MRSSLAVLAVLLATGAAAWLLLRTAEAPSLATEAEDAASAPERRSPARDTGLVATRPQVGVMQGDEARLTPDPSAGPWQAHVVRLTANAKGRVTGAGVLEALGQRLYVRARSLEDLDAFRRVEFEVEPGAELPLSALQPLFQQAGFRMEVRDPVLVLRPMTAEEHGPSPR